MANWYDHRGDAEDTMREEAHAARREELREMGLTPDEIQALDDEVGIFHAYPVAFAESLRADSRHEEEYTVECCPVCGGPPGCDLCNREPSDAQLHEERESADPR